MLGHGTEGCNYLLGVDVDMNTVDGYAITSWERGYGDMEFQLDLETIRVLEHLPATAMVQCDLAWPDGKPVVQSPRAILQAQVDKAAGMGFVALAGTELEFILFEDTYEAAHTAHYQDLTPANQYNVDYSIVGTTRVEPLLRDIRNTMYAAGLNVEGAKGECNFGQHEIAFLYDDVVVTADNHAVYKTAAKEIASQHGKSLTFMAKYDEREGNSCHIHLTLRGKDGDIVFWDDDAVAYAAVRLVRRRGAREHGRLHAALRAEHQLLQAVRRRLVRADRHRVGRGQPHLRRPARRSRRGRADGEPGARRRREPLPRARRDAGRRPARHRARSSSSSRRPRATPTTPTSPRCRTRCARRARSSRARSSPGRPWVTRSSTTTPTWPTSSWPPSRRR